jgi:glucan 1,3-beta-glucosidase
MEWNIKQSTAGSAGMWDAHIRIGGTAGTNLDLAHCPSGSQNAACQAAFMALHLTTQSSGYFEGTWVWLADHDVEAQSQGQISAFSGRGILSESQGPTWLIGTGKSSLPFVMGPYVYILC